ncbi:hypothetical protein AMAG_07642 [Allomyces macrogynus ATCC 38327]|uniref:tRNA dimethylallyltransferase n=1 Tax=Allomyces macrogynus (strain ATCC 38327) TaxID=578462 RepID=A0A0L0SIT9_ALLM3|nr:hypothetical protein, variant [Allomyces macrogynus ATCC 38327]KNE62422.1 hypothetical protein AMAG_07642 [Allomyces macrogynus ATCC 38327]|eukprot:KNE62421.1 hypothetical protein, variant [Allomyces macrogynus ATCC 38327]
MESVPHHLYDAVDPHTPPFLTGNDLVHQIGSLTANIVDADSTQLPVVVGGSHMSMEYLACGVPAPWDLSEQDAAAMKEFIASAQSWSYDAVLEQLQLVDPNYARSRPNRPHLTIHKLFLPFPTNPTKPHAHYAALDHRCEHMLRAGLLAEVIAHIRTGVPRTCPAARSIGYLPSRDLVEHILAHPDLTDTQLVALGSAFLETFKRTTRLVTRKQTSWAKRLGFVRVPRGQMGADEVAEWIAEWLVGGGGAVEEVGTLSPAMAKCVYQPVDGMSDPELLAILRRDVPVNP